MARRNPTENHSTAGAFIGSLIGSTPGMLVKSTPLGIVGSVIGGGLGGAIGASDDRRQRGAVGGAVGGVLGPIGAAVGGYIGGTKADQRGGGRRKNPTALTTALAIGGGIAAVGLGYGIYRVVQHRKALPAHPAVVPTMPEDVLQGVLGNATLEEATFLVDDVQQPILLRTTPDPLPVDDEFDRVGSFSVKVERPMGKTTIEQSSGVAFGTADDAGNGDKELVLVDKDGGYARHVMPKKAIAYLISGLTPEFARLAYEFALLQIGQNGVDWSDPQQREVATSKILAKIAPKVDWSQGLEPYAVGSAPYKVWQGVQTMGAVANQSYYNKQMLG